MQRKAAAHGVNNEILNGEFLQSHHNAMLGDVADLWLMRLLN